MNDMTQPAGRTTVSIADAEIEVFERGKGEPLLYLHGGAGIAADFPFIDLLAKTYRVIAPCHPGFGASSLPDWLDAIEDIAHIHLALMDRLGLTKCDVIGMSVGGWIAADIATKVPERIKRLVLIGPVGVKTGAVDKLDIPDIFAMPQDKFQKLVFHEPEKWRPNIAAMTDDQIGVMVRNRESLALLVWEPYMHNPKLKHRLHRAAMPVLMLRGASDGLVSADYLDRYATLFPNARIVTVPGAAHVPQVEQAAATAAKILEFLKA